MKIILNYKDATLTPLPVITKSIKEAVFDIALYGGGLKAAENVATFGVN